MAKRLQEYVKYTTQELDLYTQSEESCVRKINTNLHLTMGPFCLADFKHILMAHLVRSKVGFYDIHLDGIVLDIKKVKVLGTTAAMRADDPRLHVNINADVYVFKPEEGAELTGIVKHIGLHHVGVILYRVFNANVRVSHKVDKDEVIMEQEVKFRIRKFNLQNVFPYIDGELLTPSVEKTLAKGKKIYFKFNTENSDNGDSGIEKDGLQELDALLSIIKTEAPSEFEDSIEESRTKTSKKSKKLIKTLDNSAMLDTTSETNNNSPKKSSRKRKSSTSVPAAANTEEEQPTPLIPKQIKKELTLSDDSASSPVKKIKKEKTTPTKKHKSKRNSLSELNVSIKSEIHEDD